MPMRPTAPAPRADHTAAKTILVLLLAVLAQAAGNTCLSRAMRAIGADVGASADLSAGLIVRGMATPLVWVGILLGVVFFGLFLVALSWEDLSFVLPVSALGYVLNVAFARWFLDEPVSPIRWSGTLLVVAGVVLVSGTARGSARPQWAPPIPGPPDDDAGITAAATCADAGPGPGDRAC